MTSDQIISFVREHKNEHEPFYLGSKYTKRVQEEHCNYGFAVIQMNLNLLENWLETEHPAVFEAYSDLSIDRKRAVWEASSFHFGIYSYKQEEVDAYWDAKIGLHVLRSLVKR